MSTHGGLRVAHTPIVAPETVQVIATCPNCSVTTTLALKVSSRVVLDDDGAGTLGLRARAPKQPHVCGQTTLDLP